MNFFSTMAMRTAKETMRSTIFSGATLFLGAAMMKATEKLVNCLEDEKENHPQQSDSFINKSQP